MKVYNTITNPLEAAIVPLAPIACFPLTETIGTAAQNIGSLGSAANGTYTGATLNQIAAPGGTTAPLFDGVNDLANIYSASLSSAFNGSLGSIIVFFKVYDSGVWTDGKQRNIVSIYTTVNSRIIIHKLTTNNTLALYYKAGGTDEQITTTAYNNTNWNMAAVTWSKAADQYVVYVNGTQVGATQTGLGTWDGVISATSCILGNNSTNADYDWYGYVSTAAIFGTVLSLANTQAVYAAGQETGWTTFLYNSPVFVCDYAGFTLTGQDVTLTYSTGTVADVIGSVAGSDAAVYAVAGTDAAIYAVASSDTGG
jgi:hypothetical protein